MTNNPPQLTWTAPEFDESPAHSRALLLLLGVFLAIIVYALIENSSIMAITFVLLGTVTFLHSRKSPKTLRCAITSEGVVVEEEIYAFDNIKSFWIIYEEDERSLFLKTRGSLIASVRIPLGSANPVALREALLTSVREVKYEPTVVDTLSRFLHI
ncbi:MAG: hypothetical protein IPK84_01765 [Candidatus Moraniibacteriota bacterium]|nr:MAG: hypothetical protein IPK84_01765 [Candidatus Moranbacteria bacterium]